jgi:hypothetical protein
MTSKRALLLLAAVLLGGLGLLVVLALVFIPRYIEREVVERARASGVELEFEELDYGWEWATLTTVRARLIGVDGIELGIDTLEAELTDQELTSVAMTGVKLDAQGSAPALAVSLGAWSKRYPETYALPLSATGVSVVYRPEPGVAPWLELSQGTLASTSVGSVFVSNESRVAGAAVGRIGATWSATATSVALGLGESELGKAPLRVDVDASANPKLRLRLASTPLERLAAPFAIQLPVKDVSGSADVELAFSSREAATPASGSAHFELKGFIPPHPVELDGFVFGDTTTFDTKFSVNPTMTELTLTESRVVAGRFELKGGGAITRDATTARAVLDLSGALPCDALAQAATESRLRRLLDLATTKKAGAAARRLIGGSVGVRVRLSADVRNLAQAKVERSIGIGCGLKPVTLEELLSIGESLLPEELSKLPEELGKLGAAVGPLPPLGSSFALPPGLPPLPSNLPTFKLPSALPKLPELEFKVPPKSSASP